MATARRRSSHQLARFDNVLVNRSTRALFSAAAQSPRLLVQDSGVCHMSVSGCFEALKVAVQKERTQPLCKEQD